jgi:RNA polymerase sigma-70 factor (ECF subfamily)
MGDEELPPTRLSLLLGLNDPGVCEEAWQTFLGRYQPVIARWCRRRGMQPADVEEAAAEVVAKLFEKIRTYDPARGRFRVWLKAVVNNTFRNELRRRDRHPGDVARGGSAAEDALQEVADPADDLARELDEQMAQDLQQALADVKAQVKPSDWDAFRLNVLEELPAGEAARQLGVGVSVVYKAVYRVRHVIRQAYARLRGGD